MHRWWSFFVVFSLFFIGCGKRVEKETAERPIQLSLWHIMNYSGPREVIERAVARFEAENPDCKVQIQTFENDGYKVKLSVELASGNAPDVMFTWGGGHLKEMVRAGKVMDLTSSLEENAWKGRFIDAALDLCSQEGRIYGVPLDLSAVLLWCNSTLFEKNNIPYPKTYEELLQTCKAFRAIGIEPCALGNKNQWTGAFYFCYLANRCGGTKLFYDAAEDNTLFADDSFVRAGKMLRELVDAKAFPVGFNGLDDGPARARFLAEKSAMLLMGSWVVARVKAEKPEFMEQLKPIPFPVVAGGKGSADTVLGGVNCGFAVSAECKHPDKAVALLRYLTSEQVVGEWCEIGRIPALKTTPEQEALLPKPTQEALAALRASSSLQPYYDQYLSPRLAVEHKNTTQNIFAGVMTPEQAAAKMAEKH